EMIEELAVVVQTHTAIEQVAAPRDSAGIHHSHRTDHQVEWKVELGAKLSQHPEDRTANHLMLIGTEVHPVDDPANRGDGTKRRRAARDKVRRQADGAGPCPTSQEFLENAAYRTAEAGIILHVDPGSGTEPFDCPRLMELQHEVVGPQTWNVPRAIPALQRIVELVGQEYSLEPARLPDFVVPRRAVCRVICPIKQLDDVLGRDPVVGESMECSGDLH